jgi:hypothetical protein
MSTKTLRKRISLVAISALTAGVVSVVAAPSASAAVTATLAETNGAAASTSLTEPLSQGLITSATNAGNGSALTGTATLLSTGTLVVEGVAGGAGDFAAMQVTGGVITGATAQTNTPTVNITNTLNGWPSTWGGFLVIYGRSQNYNVDVEDYV